MRPVVVFFWHGNSNLCRLRNSVWGQEKKAPLGHFPKQNFTCEARTPISCLRPRILQAFNSLYQPPFPRPLLGRWYAVLCLFSPPEFVLTAYNMLYLVSSCIRSAAQPDFKLVRSHGVGVSRFSFFTVLLLRSSRHMSIYFADTRFQWRGAWQRSFFFGLLRLSPAARYFGWHIVQESDIADITLRAYRLPQKYCGLRGKTSQLKSVRPCKLHFEWLRIPTQSSSVTEKLMLFSHTINVFIISHFHTPTLPMFGNRTFHLVIITLDHMALVESHFLALYRLGKEKICWMMRACCAYFRPTPK